MTLATGAVHDFGRSLTWSQAQFQSLIVAFDASVRAHIGPRRGQRIAALARNSIELLGLMFACLRTGQVFVPLNWRLNAREIGEIVADCAPSLIYVQEEFRPLVQGTQCRCPSFSALLPQVAPVDPAAAAYPYQGAEDALGILLYTSGTSGRPKGVQLTLGNLRAASDNFRRVAHVTADSCLLCDAPMFHTIGLVAICHTAVCLGARLLLSPAFVADTTLTRLADPDLGVTHYFTVPEVVQRLRNANGYRPDAFARLVALFVGGAPLPHAHLLDWDADGIALVNGYGSSEAGTSIHMQVDDREARIARPGCIGRGVPGLEVSLRDRNGQPVAIGQVGEIWLRGPSITPGYWKRAAETRHSFVDGWFCTGDVAWEDEAGYYYLVGRLKDMYISGGENVYPAEVERVLATLPGVAEVAVVGMPDPQWGEVGTAFIVPAPHASIDGETVIRFARQRLASYKVPRHVQLVPSMPRTATGKVQKHLLRTPD